MSLINLPVGYYAVPDPDAPQILVVVRRGVGKDDRPMLKLTRKAPKGLLYAPQSRATLRGWRDHAARAAWRQEVDAAILADPQAAAQRYAKETVRCWKCGHKLTDPNSQALGIGPECRMTEAKD